MTTTFGQNIVVQNGAQLSLNYATLKFASIGSQYENDRLYSVVSFLDGRMSVSDHYALADLCIAKQDFSAANSWLNSIATNFELSDKEMEEYQDNMICYSILISLYEGDATLSDEDYIALVSIREKLNNNADGLALAMMIRFGDYDHVEYIPEFIEDKSYSPERTYKPLAEKSEWKIYPNPTSDYLMIQGADAVENRIAWLIDSKGSIVMTQELSQDKTMMLDLRNIIPGTYQLVIKQSGIVIFSNPVEIQK